MVQQTHSYRDRKATKVTPMTNDHTHTSVRLCSCTNPSVCMSSCTGVVNPLRKHLRLKTMAWFPPRIPSSLLHSVPGYMVTWFGFGLAKLNGTNLTHGVVLVMQFMACIVLFLRSTERQLEKRFAYIHEIPWSKSLQNLYSTTPRGQRRSGFAKGVSNESAVPTSSLRTMISPVREDFWVMKIGFAIKDYLQKCFLLPAMAPPENRFLSKYRKSTHQTVDMKST